MSNIEVFENIIKSFQKEYNEYCRTSITKFYDNLGKELRDYNINNFDSAIHKTANLFGLYINEKGEKAIELFIYYLKLYNSPKVTNESKNIIKANVKQSLNNTAQDSRNQMQRYAASKGMESRLNIKTYPIEKELEGRIEPILNKLDIEIDKYNISIESFVEKIITKNEIMNNKNKFSELINRYNELLNKATYENRYKGDYQTLKIETENLIVNNFDEAELRRYKGLPKVRAVNIGQQIDYRKELIEYKEEIQSIISKLEAYKNIFYEEVSSKKMKNNSDNLNKKKVENEVIPDYINFVTDDTFINKHLKEISKNYYYGCYNSALILSRKVLENLIIQILKNKYPNNTKEEKSLYYNTSKRRFQDYEFVLKNLYDKRNDFDIDKPKIIERLYQKCKIIKGDMNDNTHALYFFIESEKEFDDFNLQTIFDLITKLI